MHTWVEEERSYVYVGRTIIYHPIKASVGHCSNLFLDLSGDLEFVVVKYMLKLSHYCEPEQKNISGC